MLLRRSVSRAALMLACICVLILPALAAGIERVCSINVILPNAKIAKFKVYTNTGLQNGEAMGTLSVGPPAWDDRTEYFTGNLTEVERTAKGVRLAASGTFGTRVQSTRNAANAFVTVEDGKVSVSGLPPDYTVSLVKPESGSLTIYPVANPGN
jgi:hypothetical protein